MARLATTLAGLLRNRTAWETALRGLEAGDPLKGDGKSGRLRQVRGFGSNPGALDMLVYAPPGLGSHPALVVVLHGCGQSAASYDRGTGWSELAERLGFLVVCPQQTKANNAHRCFNWFEPADTKRGSGEAESIRQMVEHAVAEHAVDPSRIFVTGLSAGGAMAAAMLATCPEIFAAGAVIAGLPYGAASSVREALGSMGRVQPRSSAAWGDRVRSASSHSGPWPRLSVWHGDADTVVDSGNAAAILQQWTNLHGVPDLPTVLESADGQARAVWRDDAGRELIESITVRGMGHGTPLAVGEGDMMGGVAGPFLLDVGISSTHHIARFFGLMDAVPSRAKTGSAVARPQAPRPVVDGNVTWELSTPRRAGPGMDQGAKPDWSRPDAVRANVEAVIARALKSAGLAK